MIKTIDELKKKKLDYVKHFIKDCTIAEKIDAYYVSVEIQSRHNIVFYKSNNRPLDRADMITNAMWNPFVTDWMDAMVNNQDWFDKHIGYRIYMFYLPITKPLHTDYKGGITYIVDRIVDWTKTPVGNLDGEMEGLKMDDGVNIVVKHDIPKKKDLSKAYKLLEQWKYDEAFEEIIDYPNAQIFAKNKPEGFIFRRRKQLYQKNNNPCEQIDNSTGKSQYEFMLMDFVKFWNTNEIWKNLPVDYVQMVCYVFNEYITKWEQSVNGGKMASNIDKEGLINPCMGYRHGIDYKLVPNGTTISLCQQNELYKNIFCILLINLKKEKKEQYAVLMNKKNVEDWNEIVRYIASRCQIS